MRSRRGRSAYLSGLAAEDQAARAYLKRGAELLVRRHRNAAGEIDLILRDNGILIFVEVKQRKNPALCIKRTKRHEGASVFSLPRCLFHKRPFCVRRPNRQYG
jgi:putative endonuclease